MSKLSTSGLTATGRPPRPARPRLNRSAVLGGEYGRYPWDDWQRWAIAQGVPADLAALGRRAIREAFNHGWPAKLQSLCGWQDDGRRMVRLALRAPATARQRWQRLLDTDGYQGEFNPQTGEWVPHAHD